MTTDQVPVGIPQDVAMPPGLSPGARTIFRALMALNRHQDVDRLIRELNEGKHDDG